MRQEQRMNITIERATGPEDLEAVRMLFREYGDTLDVSLESQNFAQELAGLPGRYVPPGGCLLLARADEEPAGVVGLKALPDGTCEMKRSMSGRSIVASGSDGRLWNGLSTRRGNWATVRCAWIRSRT